MGYKTKTILMVKRLRLLLGSYLVFGFYRCVVRGHTKPRSMGYYAYRNRPMSYLKLFL